MSSSKEETSQSCSRGAGTAQFYLVANGESADLSATVGLFNFNQTSVECRPIVSPEQSDPSEGSDYEYEYDEDEEEEMDWDGNPEEAYHDNDEIAEMDWDYTGSQCDLELGAELDTNGFEIETIDISDQFFGYTYEEFEDFDFEDWMTPEWFAAEVEDDDSPPIAEAGVETYFDMVQPGPTGVDVVRRVVFQRAADPRNDDVYTLPLTQEQIDFIFMPYLEKSPFFRKRIAQEKEYHGEAFAAVINDYLSATYKKGTPNYYMDYCFGFKRSRDELIQHLDSRRYIRAEAEVYDDVQKTENTTLVNERVEVQDEGYITSQYTPTMNHVSMQESEWHVREILRKPLLVKTIEWSTGHAQSTILDSFTVPGDMIFGPHANLISSFTYFRSAVKITFVLNSTKFHWGLALASWIPQYSSREYTDFLYNPSQLVSLPHVKLDAGISNTGSIVVPFTHMNTYFTSMEARDQDFLGQLVLIVFNQLGCTTVASPSVDISIWVSFENCELHIPSHRHEIGFPRTHPPRAEAGVEGLAKAALPMLADTLAPGSSHLLSAISGAPRNCDKPTDPTEIPRMVPNTVSSLNFGSGLDRSTRLSLYPGSNTIVDPDVIATHQSDMDLSRILKIPTRLTHFQWLSAHAPGTRLRQLPVAPSVCESAYSSGDYDVWQATLLAYGCRPSKFWRGGIRLKFEIVASVMQSGRLQISFTPGLTTQNFYQSNYQNTYIIDLQEKHATEFVVPFISTRPWLRCDKLVTIEQGTDPSYLHIGEISIGTVDVYVLNRLTCPTSTAQGVDINVYISAADDFELGFVSDLALARGIGNPIPQAEAMIGEEEVTTREDQGVSTLTKGGGQVASFSNSTLSENTMDLKTVLRRYYKVYDNNENIHGWTVLSFNNTPTLSSINQYFNGKKGVQNRTHIAHFSELFTFWQGSLRYKFVAFTDDKTKQIEVKVYHIPQIFDVTDGFRPQTMTEAGRVVFSALEATGEIIGVSNIQNSWEFEIPFFTPYTQLKTISTGEMTALNSTGCVVITILAPTELHTHFELYQGAGDDFHLSYLRAAPRLLFQKDSEKQRYVNDKSAWIYNKSYINPVQPPTAEMGVFGIRNPITKTIDLVEQTTKTMETTEETMASLNKAVNGISERLGLSAREEEPNQPEPVDTSLFGLIGGFLADFDIGISLPSLVGSVAALTTGFNSFLVAETIFVKGCAIITIVRELLGPCLEKLKDNLLGFATTVLKMMNGRKQGNQRPEAEASVFEFLPAIVGTLSIAMVAIGFKSIPDDKETQKVVDGVTTKLRLFNFSSAAISNVKTLYKDMKELVTWIIDEVLLLCAPHLLAQLQLERGFEQVADWAASIDELEGTNYVENSNFDPELKKRILRLVESGEKYTRLLITGKIGKEAAVVRDYCRKTQSMKLAMAKAVETMKYRIDPFCIAIVGTTRTGKSALALDATMDLLDRMNYPADNRWISINLSEEFFTENYNGETAVYMDDYGQFEGDDQHKRFFALKSNNEHPLNMAYKKGMRFTSDFIVMTTNIEYPRPNCVAVPEALLNRRNVLIEVDWRTPDDKKQILDEGRDDLRTEDRSYLRFRFKNVMANNNHGIWMKYDEMKNELYRRASVYMDRQKRLVQAQLIRAGYTVDPVYEVQGVREQAPEIEREILAQRALDAVALRNEPAVAQAGVMVLDGDACQADPILNTSYPELFEWLVWDDEAKEYQLVTNSFDGDPSYLTAEWLAMNGGNWKEGDCKETVQRRLLLHSSMQSVGFATKLKSQLTEKLEGFKDWLKGAWKKAKEQFEWLEYLETWPAKLALGIAAFAAMIGFTAKVVHKCICLTARHYGYRCPKCGRWPELEKCVDKEWLLKEWKILYGETEAYENGRVTTLEEEQNFASLVDPGVTLEKPSIGTLARLNAEAGPYSDVTKGATRTRVVACGGGSPYSAITKGQTRIAVVAENQQRTEDLLQHRILPYIYRIRVRRGLVFVGQNCMAIGARKVLISGHFIDCMKEGDTFEVWHSNAWLPCIFSKERMVVLPNKDLVVYDMPMQFHLHKDLTKHFIEEASLNQLTKCRGALVKMTQLCEKVIQELPAIEAVREERYTQTLEGKTTTYHVQGMWKYRALTGPGTCGSILITTENKSQGQILGLHCCGNGTYGWSQLITREMLAGHVTTHLGTPLPNAEATWTTAFPEGHFGMIGCVEKGVFQTDKTTIIPTAIQGMVAPIQTAPAVLSSRDPRLKEKKNILKVGLSKYGKTPIPFSERHRAMISESIRAEQQQWTLQRKPKILTTEQAIGGIEGMDGFDRLPMSTSPGYPYVLTRPQGESGKAYLFDINNHTFQNEELQKNYDQRLTLAKRGERVVSVWTCCLKDERRSLQKVEAGSTRMFTIPPVDFSILARTYTMDWAVAMKDNRHSSAAQVGIDPQSLEWTQLYNTLASFSPYVVAGDFTNYDGTTPPDLTFDTYDDIYDFYAYHGEFTEAELHELKNVLRVVADESIHTVVLTNKTVVLTHTGNKSGHPLTTYMNSRLNERNCASAYLELAEEYAPEKATMADYRKNVKVVCYGDDNLLAIKPEIIEWFNQETISRVLARHGITYTNEEKTGVTKFKKLDDCTFLKNGFANHESISGIKVPIMAEKTILELTNWTRVAPDQDKLLEDNCNDALRFAYFRGVDYFNSLRNKIINAIRGVDKRLDIMTYNDFHYWFLFVIGKMPKIPAHAEAFFEKVAKNGNSPTARMIAKVIEKVPYKFFSMTGLLHRDEKKQRTDDRHAIAIPSGEGKTWLCNKYPGIFVDHDELLLPAAAHRIKEKGLNMKYLWGIFDEDLPKDDRRILLVHHKDNTNRKILGSFVLPEPTYIRANAYQRLRMKDATRMERDKRNDLILDLARKMEPNLFGN